MLFKINLSYIIINYSIYIINNLTILDGLRVYNKCSSRAAYVVRKQGNSRMIERMAKVFQAESQTERERGDSNTGTPPRNNQPITARHFFFPAFSVGKLTIS